MLTLSQLFKLYYFIKFCSLIVLEPLLSFLLVDSVGDFYLSETYEFYFDICRDLSFILLALVKSKFLITLVLDFWAEVIPSTVIVLRPIDF